MLLWTKEFVLLHMHLFSCFAWSIPHVVPKGCTIHGTTGSALASKEQWLCKFLVPNVGL